MEHVILSQLRAASSGVEVLAPLLAKLDQQDPVHQLAPFVANQVAASLDAAIALLEAWDNGPTAAPEAPEEAADGICRHPEANRRSTATMTKPHAWLCRACGFHYEGEPTHG